jgi:uncharacterized protein
VPNVLAQETSPYLRQHASNPVDWLPWGPVALARARELDRPLLVSIGYSACHWCHVMERESFEDPRVAALMNEEFVCVKVDREERPDVDAIYMEAVQLMTGHGGWPLNVFLTPEQLPFYGGTYFPPEPRPGMLSWTQLLQAIAAAWSERREELLADGEQFRERLSGGAQLLQSSGEAGDGGAALSEAALDRAVTGLREMYDPRHGGFAGAPKFPQASVLEFLLPRGGDATAMALATLRAMAAGGIYDQLGGGFHRYSVDASWTVPHFEKMLYDNALLARAYLHGWQAGGESGGEVARNGKSGGRDSRGDELLERVCRYTLDWMLREMRGPEGAFYSALDADSEGVEGRYYVWTVAQIHDRLDPADAGAAIAWLGVSEQGNFSDPHHPEPGLNVLTARGPEPPDAATRARIRARLLDVRATRTRPGLDDKRLTSWNALTISALAEAGASTGLNEPRYTQAAIECAEFLLERMRDGDGRLLRTYNDGHARIGAFLEDYAYLVEALLVLFETTCEERWFTAAVELANAMIARFAVVPDERDSERRSDDAGAEDGAEDGTETTADEPAGFYSTAADAEPLITRRIDLEDTPIPAGQSSAAMALLRLAQLTGDPTYQRHAERTLRLLAPIAPRHPTTFGHALQAIHWSLAPARPIACAVPSTAGDGSTAPSTAGD